MQHPRGVPEHDPWAQVELPEGSSHGLFQLFRAEPIRHKRHIPLVHLAPILGERSVFGRDFIEVRARVGHHVGEERIIQRKLFRQADRLLYRLLRLQWEPQYEVPSRPNSRLPRPGNRIPDLLQRDAFLGEVEDLLGAALYAVSHIRAPALLHELQQLLVDAVHSREA